METVLNVLVNVLWPIGIMVQPFMPDSAAALLDQLGVPPDARDFAALETDIGQGTPLPAPAGLFPRFVEAA
jgi:methionyl-tRNA synthetase